VRRLGLAAAAVLAACAVTRVFAAAQQAESAITIVLTDRHFRLSAPIERGRLIRHVRNDGGEPHQGLAVCAMRE
jgi:hypothetical protein